MDEVQSQVSDRWPTPESIKGPIGVYRLICLVTGPAAIGAALMHAYTLGAVFGAVAIFALVVWAGGGFFNTGYKEALSHAAEDHAGALLPVPEVDRATWSNIPSALGGQGYLYVIRFETGVVKVGQTNHPARRIAEHRRDAFAYNVVITDLWISQAHDNHLSNETRLIAFVHSTAGRMRREYFHGANFREVAEFAGGLVGDSEGSFFDNRRG